MKTILILGAGFGGLRTALVLGKKIKTADLDKKYEVILVDKNDYHTYTPMLYEVATTSKEVADNLELKSIVTFPIAESLAGLPIHFLKNELVNLNLEAGEAVLKDNQKITYAFAVLALGSETNDFNIPGIKQYALQLKSFLNALDIRDKLFGLLYDEVDDFKGASSRQQNIVVGGGGSTGVELAGEIAEWILDPTYKKNYDIKVSLIEGGETVLGNFDSRIVRAVTKRLKKLGVEILLGNGIANLEEQHITLKNSAVTPYDLFIWTGGVKAPDVLGSLSLQVEKQGKVKVEEEMLCVPGTPHLHLAGMVYGLGDNICFYNSLTQKPIAGVARAAIDQGTIVAKNIFEDIRQAEGLIKEAKHKRYVPMDYPYIIPVGGKWAVAKIGPFVIKGFLGWVLKGLVELNYLVSIMPLTKALSIWFAGLRIFIKNDRLG